MKPSKRAKVAKEIVKIFEKYNLTHGSDKFCIIMAAHALMVKTDDPYTLKAEPREY